MIFERDFWSWRTFLNQGLGGIFKRLGLYFLVSCKSFWLWFLRSGVTFYQSSPSLFHELFFISMGAFLLFIDHRYTFKRSRRYFLFSSSLCKFFFIFLLFLFNSYEDQEKTSRPFTFIKIKINHTHFTLLNNYSIKLYIKTKDIYNFFSKRLQSLFKR